MVIIRSNPLINSAILLVFLWATGCASTSQLTDYPIRHIDRPYTLLDGMNRASAQGTFGFDKRTEHADPLHPIPLEAYWEHALTDDLSYIWFILPLGLKYQFHHSATHTLGAMLYLQLGPPENFFLSPIGSLYSRFGIWDWVAIESQANVQSNHRFKPKGWDYTLAISSGPLFQIADTLAVRPWLGLAVEQGAISIYGGQWTGEWHGNISVNHATQRTLVPFGFTLSYSPYPQWLLELNYASNALNSRPVHSPSKGAAGISYYW